MSNEQSVLQRDPVTFEVIKNSLYSTCDEMKSVIMRTSFSPLLSLSADLSCALLDRHCKVVAQGVDIPVHLGAAGLSADAALHYFPEDTWSEGDGVLLNDPYEGGTHLPDMTLVTPLISGGIRLGYVTSRIHWPDIGGIAAGSSSVTNEILKEGLRVPPIKILEKGVIRQDMLRLILANVRVPEDRRGDFLAALAGHTRATKRVYELCDRYGASTVAQVMADTQSYSRSLVAARLSALPDVDVTHQETLDGDGIDPDCAPLVRVRIVKRGSHFRFDFTGSSPCVAGPINCSYPMTCAVVYYTLLALAGGDISPNAGVYQDVEIIAPEGTIVHAVYPYPVVAANTETSNRMVDVVMGALAQVYPERVAGGGYGSACVYTLGGFDAKRQRNFVHYETVGGGMGATRGRAGANGIRVHMGNTMNLPVESIENHMPVRFLAYRIERSSGGQGTYQGGCGVTKSLKVLADGVQASVLGERTKTVAHGVAGGAPGAPARFVLQRADGKEQVLSAKSGPHALSAGDVLSMTTAGGGGWGPAA
jgi:N-methylhydantoinase B